MANYTTDFSFTLPLTMPEQEAWAEDLIEALRVAWDDEDTSRLALTISQRAADDFEYGGVDASIIPGETEGTKLLWLSSDAGEGNVELTITICQNYCQREFAPAVAFTWAEGCSKPRLDSFGGAGVCVTADETVFFRASDALRHRDEIIADGVKS